jgi:hypothetical protein
LPEVRAFRALIIINGIPCPAYNLAMPAPKPKPAARAVATTALAAPARKAAGRAGALKLVASDPALLLAQWVDELGRLEQELVEVRPRLRRVEVLRDLIRARYAAEPAATAHETRGAQFLATLGPCAFQSTIDYDGVLKALGLKAYAAIARPTLKTLSETLAPEVLARVVSYTYSGARPLKTFPLADKGA